MSSNLYFAKSYFDLPHELKNEIKRGGGVVVDDFGDCITYKNFNKRPLWAQFVGKNPEAMTFESIGDAAKTLLNIKKRWCSISFTEHRRAELIQEKVFRYKLPQIEFMSAIPDHDWGFWSLVEKNKMLFVESIDSPFPLGEMRFKETKEPPSRAYLKLWEAFTRFSIQLDTSHSVVDLGACPGGWTWVLAQQGCQVKAIDKAPLDEKLNKFKNVQYLKKDAFKVGTQELGMPDWIFSDVICYPKELLDLVKKWMDLGVENFLCTLKFKGDTDWATIEEFMKIPNSQLVHLCANKHELTFLRKMD